MKRYALWGLVFMFLLAMVLYFKSVFSLKQPEFLGIGSLELLSLENEVLEGKAVILCRNPNAVSSRLLNSQIKIYSEDVLVSVVNQMEASDVPAMSNFEIPFKFKTDLKKLGMSKTLSGLINQALQSEKHIPLRFEGYCRIKTGLEIYKIPVAGKEELVLR